MGKVNNLRLTLNMNSDDESEQHEGGLAVVESKPLLKRPSQYQVILLNDDYTPMDFVVHILQGFFNLDLDEATNVMLAVHNNGKGVCGVYTKDIAETKAAQVNQFARDNQHPLLCEIEVIDN